MFKFFSQPLIRVTLRYGLIAGVFGIALMILLFYMDRHPFLVPLFFDFRILLFSILMVFSLKEIRDYYQQGVLAFWQAILACFSFTFTFAVICSALLYIFILLKPEFVASFISLALAQARTFTAVDIEQIGKPIYEELLVNLKATTGFYLAKRFFFQSFIISFFLTIIISVILRRPPKSQ